MLVLSRDCEVNFDHIYGMALFELPWEQENLLTERYTLMKKNKILNGVISIMFAGIIILEIIEWNV